jgi:hypothetical protein
MKNQDQFENVSQAAAVVGIVASAAIVVVAMESNLVGSAMFGVVSIFAIALATAAILGWSPAKTTLAGTATVVATKPDQQLREAA